MANTGKIEREAVRAVGGYLDKCPKVVPDIDSKGNTPIWDGYLTVYKNKSHTNKNFFARIPVQVKGTTAVKRNTFSIEREHIEAYKSERGTAFFMVKEIEDINQILYALLSTKDIDNLLKDYPKGKIKIPLQEVPSDPLDFENELYAFAANRNSEKVENTSPKEIQELVEGFEGLRKHLKEIGNKEARIELESSLDFIKNLKNEGTEEKGTIGWRDKFYYHSRKAIDLAINNIKGHDFAELQHSLGYYLDDQKQYHLAEKYYKNALDKYRKRAEANPYPWRKNDVAMTLNNLAILHKNLTRYDEAEKEYKEALKIRRVLAKTNPDAYIGKVANILNNLAILHKNLTRYSEAEKEYKEALEIRRELAKNNRDAYIGYVATTLNNLANLHSDLTRYDEAAEEYTEALEIYRELVETNHDAYIGDVAMTLNNLAVLHKDLTRYDEAEKEYKEALEIRRELAQTNRDAYIGDVAMTLENIARLQAATNRKAEAKKTTEEALDIYKELAKAYPQIWNSYVEMTEQLLEVLSE